MCTLWDGFPPLEDILARRGTKMGAEFYHSDGMYYREGAHPCPVCGLDGGSLEWFWFESPEDTWRTLCGRAGWVSFCPRDERPVEFFLEIMN